GRGHIYRRGRGAALFAGEPSTWELDQQWDVEATFLERARRVVGDGRRLACADVAHHHHQAVSPNAEFFHASGQLCEGSVLLLERGCFESTQPNPIIAIQTACGALAPAADIAQR